MRAALDAFLAEGTPVVAVEITQVRGSSPREAGAVMYVSATGMVGTIGGGQLEYMGLDEARKLLKSGGKTARMDVPLGPEIGQCCGGRVVLELSLMDDAARNAARARALEEEQARPHVYVFGAGHVGRALADLFQHLPVRCIVVDSRAEELGLVTAEVETRLTPLPEAELRAAPSGSAHIVLTHDHALDFLLAAEALERGDAAWVGMIGSATKRARFESFARAECDGLDPNALICPIGATIRDDKRPAVIAAAVVAEVIAALNAVSAPAEGALT